MICGLRWVSGLVCSFFSFLFFSFLVLTDLLIMDVVVGS